MIIRKHINRGLLAGFIILSIWIHYKIKQPSLAASKDIKTLGSITQGKPAPEFSLPALDGRTIALSNFKGKNVVIIDFWATWCMPCRMSMISLQDFHNKYKEKGIEILSINQGQRKSIVESYIKKKQYTFTVLLDESSDVGNTYGVQGIPTMLVVDRSGIVQWIHVGMVVELEKTLKKVIDPLLEK